MRVNVVKPYNSYAMRIADLIAEAFNVNPTTQPIEGQDVTIHVPWHTLIGLDTKNKYQGKHVAIYTHCNVGMEEELRDAITRADAVVCMSEHGVREIKGIGTRFKPVHCIYLPIDKSYQPGRIIVGIVGAEQPNGRKGAHRLLDLAWAMDCTPFHFVIIGTGWEDTVTKMKNIGLSTEYVQNVDVIPYQQFDVLLCTGEREGGPLPLAEGLAAGIRVISPDYGLASDLLEVEDIYHNLGELKNILQGIVDKIVKRVHLVSTMNVDNYIQDMRGLINRVGGGDPTSRYEWVNRIVAETGARRLMEIGTWSGDRAVQMIHTAQENHEDICYVGYDLFQNFTKEHLTSENSKTPISSDIVYRKIANTGAQVSLVVGDTKNTLKKMDFPKQDFIYIDGGHSWETIESDWVNIQKFMHDDTVVLFDDFYYNKLSEVEGIGCQRLIHELEESKLWDITYLEPRERWQQVWGELDIGMVKVKHV